jgi:hypothetical protein
VLFGSQLPIIRVGTGNTNIQRETADEKVGPPLLAGVGAISLVVAFIQRRGPGTFCSSTATRSGCNQYLDPRPWLVVGVVMVVVAMALQVRAIRRASRPVPTPR